MPGSAAQPDFPPFPRVGVYLIADAATLSGFPLLAAVEAALSAGIRLVQYRNKSPLSRAMLEEAASLRTLTRAHKAQFIINDRADVARMVAADGVHVGQDDLPVAAVRRVMGKESVVGVSTHSMAEAERAVADGADYVGFGNVFGTTTKKDAVSPVGVDELVTVCAAVDIPVYAIGGVAADNLKQVASAGASGGAVVSAILSASDPAAASRDLLSIWRRSGV